MDRRQRRAVFVLIMLGLLLAAGLTGLTLQSRHGPSGAADVHVRIDDAEGRLLDDGAVHLNADANDALTALETLGRAHGFIVETKGFAGLGTMVVGIAGIRNQGACGWVYEVNGASGDRAADAWNLSDGDELHWFWSCHT